MFTIIIMCVVYHFMHCTSYKIHTLSYGGIRCMCVRVYVRAHDMNKRERRGEKENTRSGEVWEGESTARAAIAPIPKASSQPQSSFPDVFALKTFPSFIRAICCASRVLSTSFSSPFFTCKILRRTNSRVPK